MPGSQQTDALPAAPQQQEPQAGVSQAAADGSGGDSGGGSGSGGSDGNGSLAASLRRAEHTLGADARVDPEMSLTEVMKLASKSAHK